MRIFNRTASRMNAGRMTIYESKICSLCRKHYGTGHVNKVIAIMVAAALFCCPASAVSAREAV